MSTRNSFVGKVGIDFATPTNATFSVEAWVKGFTQTADNGVITKGTGGGGEQFNLDCGGSSQAFRFFVRDSAGSAHLATSSIVPNSKWHHLVGICDQLRSNVCLYVDGTNYYSTTIVKGSGILSSTNAMTIGSRQSGATTAYDLQFLGYVMEVAVYNYALSSNQVRTHFLAATNRAPFFYVDPFSLATLNTGQPCAATVATNAVDPNGDSLLFSKVSGPDWLTVAANGSLSGTPLLTDVGANVFVISTTDPSGLSANATLNVSVVAPPTLNASLSAPGGDLNLSWSGGSGLYQVQWTTNLLNPVWVNFGEPTAATNLTVSITNDAAFYRLISL